MALHKLRVLMQTLHCVYKIGTKCEQEGTARQIKCFIRRWISMYLANKTNCQKKVIKTLCCVHLSSI